MLVLARLPTQQIVITTPEGREIVITLTEIESLYRARIGITADRDVVIMRQELLEKPTPKKP